MSAANRTLFAAVALLAIAAAEPAAFDADGVRVEASVSGDPATGQARLRITMRDVQLATPVSGRHPLAWLASDANAERDQDACNALLGSLLQNSLSNRARSDFNAMKILSLSDRNDLMVLNPTVSLGGTQIEHIAHFNAEAGASALSTDGSRIAVGVRGEKAVRLFHSATLDPIATVPLSGDVRQAAWRADRLVVATDQDIALIGDGKLLASAHHGLAGAPTAMAVGESASLVALGREARIFDHASGSLIGKVHSDAPLVAARWVPLSRAFLLLDAQGGLTLREMNGAARGVMRAPALRTIEPLGEGAQWLGISEDGGSLVLIDGSNGAELRRTPLSGPMARIIAGQQFAYVYSNDGDTVDVVGLKDIKDGKLDVISVPMSERKGPASFGDGPRVAMLPGGAVVASPTGKELAYYVEGMMAPMGAIPHYGMATRALYGVNESLTEREPGVYVASAPYRGGGALTLAMLLDNPRRALCVPAKLPVPAGDARAPSIAMDLATSPARPRSNEPIDLVLSAPASMPSASVRFLVWDQASWQRRVTAVRGTDGRYRARVKLPTDGLYLVTADVTAGGRRLGSRSLDLSVGDSQ